MASNTRIDTLRNSVEEIYIAIKLEEHAKVSSLCLKVMRQLVRVYDDELLEDNYNNDDDEDSEEQEGDNISRDDSEKVRILKVICDKLRQLSRISSIYGELVEYVRIQDSVCLAQLVGALSNNGEEKSLLKEINSESLVKILRQSIILMREINFTKPTNQSIKQPSSYFFDAKELIRVDEVDQTRYLLKLEKFWSTYTSEQHSGISSELTKELIHCKDLDHSRLYSHLNSIWFLEFVSQVLDHPYPMDRFTILIAILIVATESHHKILEQLISELIDQIFHQESNSCNIEELMQLTQVGSVWLTKRKRFMSTCGHQMQDIGFEMDEDDEIEVLGDGSIENDDESLSPMSSVNRDSSHQVRSQAKKLNESRIELRKVIDNELLIGTRCNICNREPGGDWLEPLQLFSCPKCNLRLNYPYCSLSYEPIMIIPLEQLLETLPTKLEEFIIVNSNEWTARALEAAREVGIIASKPDDGSKGKRSISIEQIDIYENFERLTVLRRNSADEETNGVVDSLSSDDNSSDIVSNFSNKDDTHTDVLTNFMKYRLKTVQQLKVQSSKAMNELMGSESVQMIRYLGNKTGSLQIYSGDLLTIDGFNNSFRLYLFTTKSGRVDKYQDQPRDDFIEQQANGRKYIQGCDIESILVCQKFSPTSQLELGCGQLFSSFELIRQFGQPVPQFSHESITCPSCGSSCRLIELRPGI